MRSGHRRGEFARVPHGLLLPGDEGGQKMVVVERHSEVKKVVVVPSKGPTGSYAARVLIGLIEDRGGKDRSIIVKSDQEPAVDDVCHVQGGCQDDCRAGGRQVEGFERYRCEGGPEQQNYEVSFG